MPRYSKGQRRNRWVRRTKNRKGVQLHQAVGSYDIDALSHSISSGEGDNKARVLSRAIQTRVTIGSPDDVYEKEADRTADTVAAVADAGLTKTTDSGPQVRKQEEELAQTRPLLQRQEEEEEVAQTRPLLQRQEEEEEVAQTRPLLQRQEEEEEEEAQASPLLQKQEEEEEAAQPKPDCRMTSGSKTLRTNTATRLRSRKGMGNLMSTTLQNFMEAQFNKDFSGVRIHTDSEAGKISQELNAQAFTLGKDIYFNAGKYNPESKQGKHLLAHELTHVVQQNQNLKKSK